MRWSLVIAHCSLVIAVVASGLWADGPATAPAPATQPTTQYGQPVTTDVGTSESVTYRSTDSDIQAYYLAPKLPAKAVMPSVILVHDIYGLTPYIKSEAEMYARQGYAVLVPNLYSRLEQPNQKRDGNAAWVAYDKTSDAQVMHDLSASVDYLQAEGKPTAGQPLAIVGYDMGGIYAMMMAGTDLRISAAVNFYGRILYATTSAARPSSPVESLFNLRAPLLSFYGNIDPQVPDAHIRALQSRLANNPNNTFYDVVRYPNVGHSFLNPSRQGYDKDAAAKAHEKTELFLARFLRAAPPKSDE